MAPRSKRKRASLADVATHCQLSTATVSRAFADPERVSMETRSRVMEAAAKLGYFRDGAPHARTEPKAGAKPAGHSGLTISMLFQQETLEIPGYAAHLGRMISGVELACQELGCTLHTVILRLRPYTPEEILKLCGETNGVVAICCAGHLSQLATVARRVPVVTLNDIVRRPNVASFTTDDEGSVQTMVGHLRELGHERIVYFHINDSRPANPNLLRRHGAWEALRCDPDAGLQQARTAVLPGRDCTMAEQAERLLTAWLAEPTPPTALLCGNDSYALAFIQAAQRLGIAIPERLSIVGIDDVDYAGALSPPLTTIRGPLEVMGRDAVRYLVAKQEGRAVTSSAIHSYPVSLVVRDSAAEVGGRL